MIRSTTFSAATLALCLLAGCSGSDAPNASSDNDIADTETSAPAGYTVDTVRADAADAMAAITSVHFTVTRSGVDVAIDEAGLVTFGSAEARFAAPASADAIVQVQLLGSDVELGAVAIDGTLWLTDPVTGTWQDATGTIDFDPAKIFSLDDGVSNILATGLTEAMLTSDQPDDNGQLHLEGVVDAADVTTLTSGLVSESAEASVAIDATTFLVTQIDFDTLLDDGVATWLVELSDYNADVVVAPPDLDG